MLAKLEDIVLVNTNVSAPLVSRTCGTGKDLVLLHGWGMNSGVFEHFIPLLEQEFRVTTIDLPGFGENHHLVPTPYTVASLAQAIKDYVPAASIVAGWSLGGLVAQYLTIHYPQQISGLITIASTPCFVKGPRWPGINPQLLSQFESELAENYQKTLERFLAIQAMGSKTARQDIKAIKQSITAYPTPSVAALKAGLNLLSQEDLRPYIGRIQQPTLRIYGRLDSLVPTSGIDGICELQPQCDTVVLPHASHAPFISHPQQSADIIRQFALSV
ncbi:pimeloyl-ACP methyl ester esterase BioH [Alteromonas sp. C1M14]|uniref:pimeloyl-ACP methyl ester esterase BioH n=1 Tax=Alteromonas sp. C1M14 TaxID=2841567 RepID=UPI001C0A609D|nr:pimeloyl-ACP methyl ester esterase BioH [Alteromonas sp. C1M14]MBU2978361.1 pimeloyl-ACP methyl ester esterase BioH [Alteromonas sp. C1M14]